MNSDIFYFLKLFNSIQCLFGIKKLKIEKKLIVETGFFNYLYIFILSTILSAFTISECYINIKIFHKYQIVVICAIVSMGYILLSFSIVTAGIQNIFTSPKHSEKIFELMLDIEKYLGPPGRNFKKSLIFQHFTYFGLRISFYIYDLSASLYSFYFTSLYHFIMIHLELEVFYATLKINIVARYFEKINEHLLKFYSHENKYDEQDPILLKIWRNSDKNIVKNLNIRKLTMSVQMLSEIVNSVNSSYGMKVLLSSLVNLL